MMVGWLVNKQLQKNIFLIKKYKNIQNLKLYINMQQKYNKRNIYIFNEYMQTQKIMCINTQYNKNVFLLIQKRIIKIMNCTVAK